MSAALTLPDPQGGCSCTPTSQDAGDGLVEHLLDYDPACPEHSTHLYDPRRGEWTIRPTDFGPREPTGAQIEAVLLAHSWHQIGCRCGWENPVPFENPHEQWEYAFAKHVSRALIAARAIS